MKILIWNMNYWQNTHIYNPKNDHFRSIFFKNNLEEIDIWKNECKDYIRRLNTEIVLLQEINPFSLYGINYDKNNQNQYKYIQENNTIFYHEIYNELFDEKLNENFWGNAIIIKSDLISYLKNNIILEGNSYYGKNGLMSYDFIKSGLKITVINYYNKKNRNRNIYSMPYDIRSDLEIITKERNENIIIFAGDFNSDKERDTSNRKFFKFIEEIGFENFTTGDEFKNNTMVPKARPYPNDKVFIKNKQKVKKIICKKNTDIQLSDHYPILCEIIEG
jgi:endonuclease/exonuclease/phosphatase family metal-dependent hydrolase